MEKIKVKLFLCPDYVSLKNLIEPDEDRPIGAGNGESVHFMRILDECGIEVVPENWDLEIVEDFSGPPSIIRWTSRVMPSIRHGLPLWCKLDGHLCFYYEMISDYEGLEKVEDAYGRERYRGDRIGISAKDDPEKARALIMAFVERVKAYRESHPS